MYTFAVFPTDNGLFGILILKHGLLETGGGKALTETEARLFLAESGLPQLEIQNRIAAANNRRAEWGVY